MSAGASFICLMAARRCFAAIPASSSRAARRCSIGSRRWRRSWKAPRSHSASVTTMSRRSAPGAIACAATSRMPRASGASRSASPMSSSTCRSGPRKRICAFYPEIMGMQAELVNGDGTVARVKVGKDQYLQFRETDRRAAGLRRPPRADLHHRFLRPLPPPAGARPGLAGRQPVPIPLSRHRRSRMAAGICSRSSTRCAAPRTRCSCGRWSTAIRPRPTAPTRPATSNGRGRWGRMSTIEGRSKRRSVRRRIRERTASVRQDEPSSHALRSQRSPGMGPCLRRDDGRG